MSGRLGGTPTPTPPQDDQRSRTTPRPLTPGQRGLWFLHQLDPRDVAYNTCTAIELRGRLSVAALRAAVAGIGLRHDSLRAVVRDGDVEPELVCAAEPPAMPLVDLTALPEAAREAELERRLPGLAAVPFDLRQGPPARWTLFRLGPQRHVLVLDVHHFVFDRDSLGVVCRELQADYTAAARGVPSVPSPAAADEAWPGDIAVTAQAWTPAAGTSTGAHASASASASADTDAAGLRYWQDALADAPRQTRLFDGPPRTAGREPAPISRTVAIAPAALGPLAMLCRQEAATTFSAVLAVLGCLIARHTGQTDAVIGAPVTLRRGAEDAGVVGLMVNTLPLRVRAEPTDSFRTVLRRTRGTVLDALDHRGVAFHRIVESLGGPRSGSPADTPLFQILLAHQEPAVLPELDGLRAVVRPIPAAAAKFGLSVTSTVTPDGIELVLESDARVCSPGELDDVARHLAALIPAVAKNPDCALTDLPVLSTTEQAELARLARGVDVEQPIEVLHELVLAGARRSPDAIAAAVRTPEGPEGPDSPDGPAGPGGVRTHLTYAGLRRAASRLAAALRTAGAVPDQPVAILLERGIGLPVAYLGVLAAGSAMFPLEPGDPDRRLARLVADSGAVVAVTHRDLAARAEELGLRPVVIEDFLTPAPGVPLPAGAVHAEQAAYLLYTSGSTGEPKGVTVPHGAIVNRMQWLQRTIPLRPNESALAKAPLSFDVSMGEVFAPLIAEATLVLAEPGGERDPQYLVSLMERERIAFCHFVPSMFAMLLPEVQAAGTRLPALRTVVCSGEVLSTELSHRALGLVDADVYNLYGPTEAAVDVTYWRCEPPSGRPVVLGRPISNVECPVLDEALSPVPRGALGEVHLSGRCLARGYLNRPAATARAFRPAPGIGGGRLYRTGDFGRWNAEGHLELVGRRDHQVKIAGRRVEPGEVAEAMRRLPGVLDAAVVSREDGLAGFVVLDPQGGARPGAEELAEALHRELPAALVPLRLAILERLPRKGAKTDLAALRDLAAPVVGAGRGIGPRTDLERKVAEVWSRVLELDEVGVTDRFFEAGGTSLTLLRLHRELVGSVAPALSVRDLFSHPTVAALARFISDEGSDGSVGGADDDAAAAMARAGRRRAVGVRRRRSSSDD